MQTNGKNNEFFLHSGWWRQAIGLKRNEENTTGLAAKFYCVMAKIIGRERIIGVDKGLGNKSLINYNRDKVIPPSINITWPVE